MRKRCINSFNKVYGLNAVLKEKIEYWKEKLEKIINYISYKVQGLFGDKEKEKYQDVANDLYMNNIIDKKEYNKINSEKEKDDFYR